MSAMRYRLGQAVVISLLSALITACAVFAPLYDRAMQQAATAVTLENAPSVERDLQIFGPPSDHLMERTDPAVLARLLPDSSLFEPPVAGRNALADLDLGSDSFAVPEGDLWWREGQCDHIRITAGSCPDRSREILVTDNEAEMYDLTVGSTVRSVAAKPPLDIDYHQPPTPSVGYQVVGTYRADDEAWWQGLQLEGLAGIAAGDIVQHDVWLTDESTFGGTTPFLALERPWVGSRLRTDTVGVDELAALESDLGDLRARAEKVEEDDELFADSITSLVTSLPELTDEVDAQIEQSRTTVPLLLVQLGLLGVIVLWLMLLAATDQRRPEVVVARLRGRGAAGARSLLMGELLPPVLAGIVPGAAVAILASTVARAYALPGDPPFELPQGMVASGIIAVTALALVTYAAVYRVARESLGALLHRTHRRRSGWALGAGDAVAIAACGACVVAFVTGSLTGPVALAAPALLSALVGLVLAHLFTPVAMRTGRTLLRRGRLRAGVSLLEASRSVATRRTVALATVASALAVFSVCGLLVGERNRAIAAEQAAGAPLIAELHGQHSTADNLRSVRRVLARIDPESTRVTPVVRAAAPSGGPTTFAVEPQAFRQIALFGPGHAPSARQWKAVADGEAREPIAVITTGALFEDEVTIVGLDGIEQDGEEIAAIDRVPGGGPDVALVDLTTAQELAPPDADSTISLWFADDDPALLERVSADLEADGISVAQTRTLSDVRRGLDETVAAWSLRLGVVVGLAAVAIAVLALSVLTVTGWRTRARDLASLWLAGVDRHTVERLPGAAQLLPVILGVFAGAASGVLGALLTLPDIPLFAVPPAVDTIDLSVPWRAVGLTTIGCLLVLGTAAVLLGRAVAAAARLDRVRETA
ncbi:FtsX-like permease family protein [Nocardioides sp. NPDC047086]|uniref:FtsX-like permease family protein n=1 Tax=Nocardioides sp. NPDC047086 TaxID=3154810 RepID=UPI0033E9C1BD